MTSPQFERKILRLTSREAQILHMLTTGPMKPEQVAEELGIALSTVRQRIRDAKARNGYRDRFALGLALVMSDEIELVRSDTKENR